MDLFNRLLTIGFDGLLAPFHALSPWIGMCVATLVVTAVLLLVFKWTSRPEQIRRTKGRLIARTLELVLYQHDLGISTSAIFRILWANALYLRELLIPLACALAIGIPLLAQCAAYFEFRPLHVGEHAVLAVAVTTSGTGLHVPLQVPSIVQTDTQDFAIPQRKEVTWRLTGHAVGTGLLEMQVGGQIVSKTITVGEGLRRVSSLAPSRSAFWDRLLYPSEPAISPAEASAVSLQYPPRNWYVGTWNFHWLVALFLLSLVFGFLLKKPLGVTL